MQWCEEWCEERWPVPALTADWWDSTLLTTAAVAAVAGVSSSHITTDWDLTRCCNPKSSFPLTSTVSPHFPPQVYFVFAPKRQHNLSLTDKCRPYLVNNLYYCFYWFNWFMQFINLNWDRVWKQLSLVSYFFVCWNQALLNYANDLRKSLKYKIQEHHSQS